MQFVSATEDFPPILTYYMRIQRWIIIVFCSLVYTRMFYCVLYTIPTASVKSSLFVKSSLKINVFYPIKKLCDASSSFCLPQLASSSLSVAPSNSPRFLCEAEQWHPKWKWYVKMCRFSVPIWVWCIVVVVGSAQGLLGRWGDQPGWL